MFRFFGFALLVACGQTAATNVDFACGDAGAVCHSSSQYCEIVTATGGASKDSGAPPTSIAQCAPLAGCTTCDCLVEAGGCIGSQTSCVQSSSAITFAATCPQ